MLAVKKDDRADSPDLSSQHQARVEHAGQRLPMNPLRDYGTDRLVAEARAQAARFVPAGSLEWLPDPCNCFIGLA
jgi:hypothetical protein